MSTNIFHLCSACSNENSGHRCISFPLLPLHSLFPKLSSITTPHHLLPIAPSNLLYKVNYQVELVWSHRMSHRSQKTIIRAHSLPPCSPTNITLRSKINDIKIQFHGFQIWEGWCGLKKTTCELHLHLQQLKNTLFFFMKQIKFEQREDSISFCRRTSRHSSQNFENRHCQLLKTRLRHGKVKVRMASWKRMSFVLRAGFKF